MDDLPEGRLVKLGNYPADLRMNAKRFYPVQNVPHQPLADIGNALFGLPLDNPFKVCHRGLGQANGEPCH